MMCLVMLLFIFISLCKIRAVLDYSISQLKGCLKVLSVFNSFRTIVFQTIFLCSLSILPCGYFLLFCKKVINSFLPKSPRNSLYVSIISSNKNKLIVLIAEIYMSCLPIQKGSKTKFNF